MKNSPEIIATATVSGLFCFLCILAIFNNIDIGCQKNVLNSFTVSKPAKYPMIPKSSEPRI